MKEVPKKKQPDVSGGYIAPEEYPDGTCIPWTPKDPDPIFPDPSIAPCESPTV